MSSVLSSAVRRCVERDLQYSDIPVPFFALSRLTTRASTLRWSWPRNGLVYFAGMTMPTPDAQPSVTTCTAALGASFEGGTTDGPRMFDFTQGETSLNFFWKTDSNILSVPTQEQVHQLDLRVGSSQHSPQVFPIGSLVTVNTPNKRTQCAGDGCERRSQESSETLARTFRGRSVVLPTVTRTLCATYEEYHDQRYETGSNVVQPSSARHIVVSDGEGDVVGYCVSIAHIIHQIMDQIRHVTFVSEARNTFCGRLRHRQFLGLFAFGW